MLLRSECEEPNAAQRRDGKRSTDLLVAIAWGVHPFPSRTR